MSAPREYVVEFLTELQRLLPAPSEDAAHALVKLQGKLVVQITPKIGGPRLSYFLDEMDFAKPAKQLAKEIAEMAETSIAFG